MTKRSLPTPEELRQLLRYDPETGKLYWKPRPLSMFPSDRTGKSWNTRYAGKEAFRVGNLGYLQGNLVGFNVKAHRVAWAIQNGAWPDGDIDHKNMNRADNRISNLRPASRTENRMNTRAQINCKSGYKGVHWDRDSGKWRAQLSRGGKCIFSAKFNSLEDASEAYAQAAKKYHGEFARTE